MAEIQLPTQLDLDPLPVWSQVAFAARCARRVFPLLTEYWPSASSSDIAALELALKVAEGAAHPGAIDNATVAQYFVRYSAHPAAMAVLSASRDARGKAATANPRAYAVTQAIEHAVLVAAHADAIIAPRYSAPQDAAAAAAAARSAVAGTVWESAVVEGIARDFRRLVEAARSEGWPTRPALVTADVKRLPADFFGLLWPNDLAASVPAVREAERWLKELMGDNVTRVRIDWAFVGPQTFPSGIRALLAVPEWEASESREFTWEQVESQNYFRGELVALWGKVLATRMRAMLREDLPQGAE